MNARRVLTGLVLLLVVGCQGAPAPEATPAADAPLPTPGLTLTAPEPYLMGDGSVDYPALRRDYGEPNRNLILNPRSTDVARTVSRRDVKVFPNKLVFPSTAVWAARRSVGDTLYCDTACGIPFLRNVTAIQRQGDSIVLSTEDGKVTDVIQHGWIHTEVPLELEVPRFDQNIKEQASDDKSAGPTEDKGDKKEQALTGKLSGKVGATISFKTTVTVDVAIDWGGISWTRGVQLPRLMLFKLVVTGGPAIDLIAEVTAEGAYKPPEWNFFSARWILGAIPIGPVSIIPTLEISATGSAEAEGKVQVTASAHADVSLSAGVIYNENVNPNWTTENDIKRTTSANFNITGEASARVGVELAVGLRFSIAGMGGPSLYVTGEVGVEASANYSSNVGTDGNKCAASIDANAYLILTGKIGAQACVPFTKICIPKKEQFFPIAQQKWTFPEPVWHYDVPAAKLRMCLANADCEAPQKKCAKGCMDLTKDPKNCGACGRVCAYQTNDPNSTCLNSVCTCRCSDGSACPNGKDTTGCPCPSGQKDCGSGCQNVANDKLNCGACGHKCVDATGYANSVCAGGSCSCKCPDGTDCPKGTTASCTPRCVCADGSQCPNGDRDACPCPRGQQDCGRGCQDILSDTLNCGGCNNICFDLTNDDDSVCVNGTCTCKCEDGSACPGADRSSCPNICKCSDGSPCPEATGQAGCTCPEGKADCGYGQGCQDILSDPLNCGACGQACAYRTGDPNSRCVNGLCTCTCANGMDCTDFGSTASCSCPQGQQDCGAGCIPVTNDPRNCGGCGQSCWQETGDPRATCSGGVCGCKCPDGSKCPGLDTSTCCKCANGSSCPNGDPAKCCTGGTTSCSGQCVNLQSDQHNCGQCGRDCVPFTGIPESTCVGGKCSCTCPGSGAACPDGTWWSCPK